MSISLAKNYKKFHECFVINPRPLTIPTVRETGKKHYICPCCNGHILEPCVTDFFSINHTKATHWQMKIKTHEVLKSNRDISEFRIHPGQSDSIILGAWKRGKRGEDHHVRNIIFRADSVCHVERVKFSGCSFILIASEHHPDIIDIFGFKCEKRFNQPNNKTPLASADFLYRSLENYILSYTQKSREYIQIREARVDKLLDSFFAEICEESAENPKEIVISPVDVRNCRFDMLDIFGKFKCGVDYWKCTAANCTTYLMPLVECFDKSQVLNVGYGSDDESDADSDEESLEELPISSISDPDGMFEPDACTQVKIQKIVPKKAKIHYKKCSHIECQELKCRYKNKPGPPTQETYETYAFNEIKDIYGNRLDREYFKNWKDSVHDDYLLSKQQASESSLKKVTKLENVKSANLKLIGELKLKLIKHSDVVAWNKRHVKDILEFEVRITDFLAKQFEWKAKVSELELELENARLELECCGIDWENEENRNLEADLREGNKKSRPSVEIEKELTETKNHCKKLTKEIKNLKKNVQDLKDAKQTLVKELRKNELKIKDLNYEVEKMKNEPESESEPGSEQVLKLQTEIADLKNQAVDLNDILAKYRIENQQFEDRDDRERLEKEKEERYQKTVSLLKIQEDKEKQFKKNQKQHEARIITQQAEIKKTNNDMAKLSFARLQEEQTLKLKISELQLDLDSKITLNDEKLRNEMLDEKEQLQLRIAELESLSESKIKSQVDSQLESQRQTYEGKIARLTGRLGDKTAKLNETTSILKDMIDSKDQVTQAEKVLVKAKSGFGSELVRIKDHLIGVSSRRSSFSRSSSGSGSTIQEGSTVQETQKCFELDTREQNIDEEVFFGSGGTLAMKEEEHKTDKPRKPSFTEFFPLKKQKPIPVPIQAKPISPRNMPIGMSVNIPPPSWNIQKPNVNQPNTNPPDTNQPLQVQDSIINNFPNKTISAKILDQTPENNEFFNPRNPPSNINQALFDQNFQIGIMNQKLSNDYKNMIGEKEVLVAEVDKLKYALIDKHKKLNQGEIMFKELETTHSEMKGEMLKVLNRFSEN